MKSYTPIENNRTFDELHEEWKTAKIGSRKESIVVGKIVRKAISFVECRYALSFTREGTKAERYILQKMAAIAAETKSKEQWEKVAEWAPKRSKVGIQARKELERLE
jgi:hypothetical protein